MIILIYKEVVDEEFIKDMASKYFSREVVISRTTRGISRCLAERRGSVERLVIIGEMPYIELIIGDCTENHPIIPVERILEYVRA